MKNAEKDHRKLSIAAIPILLLLSLPLLCIGLDFFLGTSVPFNRWVQYFSSSEIDATVNKTLVNEEFVNFHLGRLVRGDDRRNLDAVGFACDRTYHSLVCVSNRPAKIDTGNMTVYLPSDSVNETVIRPYARQEDTLNVITPVRIRGTAEEAEPEPEREPPCRYKYTVPAVVFSSGSTGNVFHEMNEIIIPLYITTKQFQSKVVLILEDFKLSFIGKYGKVLSLLSSYEVINPGTNSSIHCFPGVVVGLKYHDNLALNSSDIPGGYSMPDFRSFLRQAYGLRYQHVSQISKPRLMLLSRTNTRRILNEDEMIAMMKEIGFEVLVIRRSKIVKNLNKFTQLINSCSVMVGAHGAGLTNEIFLPTGAVMVQVELLGTEWASNTYYGDTARAMGVHYLRYKIEPEESSLIKLYGTNSSVVRDPGSVYRAKGYRAARTVFLDQQNVRLDLNRFRVTMVEAFSIVTDWEGR